MLRHTILFQIGFSFLILFCKSSSARIVNNFNTAIGAINHISCLQNWIPHGIESKWVCQNGMLKAESSSAGLKETRHPFIDGAFSFDIKGRIPLLPNGKGETVIWLRNGNSGNGMERVRVVIEEEFDKSANIRIEQFLEGAGYERLNILNINRYVGHYVIALKGEYVLVRAANKNLLAVTNVKQIGTTFLFSSDGEGARTVFDNFDLGDNETYIGG